MDCEKKNKQRCVGRPTTFDRKELLDQVMELFWEKGYSNLSFNEVAKATGLTRASLYNAFSTKEELFLEVVETYLSNSPVRALYDLESGERVGKKLQDLFDQLAELLTADSRNRGCLTVNCIAEIASMEGSVADQFKRIQREQEELYASLMQRAVAQGELPETTQPEIAGALLQAFVNGLALYSKQGLGKAHLQAMTRTFLRNMGFTLTQ